MMQLLLMLMGLAILAAPVVAFVLAVVAKAQAGRAESQAKDLVTKIDALTRQVSALTRRLDEEGKARSGAGAAAPPAAATQAAAVPKPPSVAASEPAPVPGGEKPGAPSPAGDAAGPSAAPPPMGGPPHAPVPAPRLPPPVPAVPQASTLGPPAVPPPAAPVPTAPPRFGTVPPPTSTPASGAPAPRKAPSGGWERRLGIVVPALIGAVALTLSGAFLVRYSIERGLLSPEIRVVLAVLLGAALLGAGEWLRTRSSATAQGASAAGVAVLYSAFLAATVLYHLISPWLGFGLIVLTTASGVALSLRQGVVVAVIGLLGGFFTPYWIGVVSASPGRLFTYLLLLQAGILVVTRKRRWPGLAALALVLGLGAVLHRAVGASGVSDAPWVGAFLLVSTAVFLVSAHGWPGGEKTVGGAGSTPLSLLLGAGSLGAAFLGLAVLAVRTRFDLQEWLFLGILSVACVALGRLQTGYLAMPWVALLTITALLFGWILDAQPPDLWPIWWVVAGAALIFGAGGYAAHFGSDHPAHWATLSAAGGLAGFGFAYFAHKVVGGPAVHWGFVALGLGVPYLLGAVRAASPAVRGRLGEEHLAALCVAVTTLVSLAVPLELERHWIAVAWALEAAALAWLLWKLGVRVLGYLSLALGAGAVVRLLLNPMVLSYPVGDLPVFNWFLYGYGLPALAFAGACLWMERARWGRWAQSFGWGSGAFVFALLTLEVRQGFHPGGLMGPPPTLVEWATYSHLWLLAAVALLAAYRRSERSLLAYLGVAFLVVSAGKICLVDAFAANPLWNPTDVGSLPVLNWLLYVYGLPALAFWLSGRLLDSESDEGTPPAGFLHAIALGLAFLLLTLEIRQVFHPGVMSRGSFSLAENAVITCAWLLMAAAMTYANRNVGSGVLRWGARLLLGLSAAKLLLVDVLALNPLWWHRDVGELPVLNLLLLAYVLPAALLWVAALAGGDPVLREHGRRVAFGGSLVLGFVWLSLGVRQFFHPRFLDAGPLSNAENYSYSAAWILFALMLLAIGIARRGRVVRVASLVVIFLAVSKVFLFDLRHLQDLYRVMSFLGLGVSLFLIAILYQRFVFSGAEHES